MKANAPRLSTPKPDDSFCPTADEFAAWCEHPTTRWVAAALESKAQSLMQMWSDMLFTTDDGNLVSHHTALSARVDSLRVFLEANHADYLSELDPQAWKGTYGDQ